MRVWAARDKDGSLWGYARKPQRVMDKSIWTDGHYTCVSLGTKPDPLPSLRWADNPIEVEIYFTHGKVIVEEI